MPMPPPTKAGDTSPTQLKEMTFGVAGSVGRFQAFGTSTKVPRHGSARPTSMSRSAWVVDATYPGAD